MSKPDNCKFCGSEKTQLRIERDGDDRWFVFSCDDCYARTGFFLSEAEALAAWNRKPEPEPITPEGLERLGFVLFPPDAPGQSQTWRFYNNDYVSVSHVIVSVHEKGKLATCFFVFSGIAPDWDIMPANPRSIGDVVDLLRIVFCVTA